MMDALGRAVVASNHYDGEALEELRLRMTLITTGPALQAHSMVRYPEWRRVVPSSRPRVSARSRTTWSR